MNDLNFKGSFVKSITTSKITQNSFSEFGNIINTSNPTGEGFSVNEGRGKRFNYPNIFDHKNGMNDPEISIYQIKPSTLPVEIAILEQHPDTSQLFLPITGGDYLVVVAPTNSDGLPDISNIKAFIAPPDIGISYHQGIWHLPMMSLEKAGSFAMLMWESGTNNDCIIHHLVEKITIL
jgi:ureidoglycolate lyase